MNLKTFLMRRSPVKVDLTSSNLALKSIFDNPNQVITLDANFLIPPDRSKYARRAFDFQIFKKIWLEPILKSFPNLAIHEAVYDELVLPSVKDYVDLCIASNPPQLLVHRDSSLSPVEQALRDSIEAKIYPLTKYDPLLDNKDEKNTNPEWGEFLETMDLLYPI